MEMDLETKTHQKALSMEVIVTITETTSTQYQTKSVTNWITTVMGKSMKNPLTEVYFMKIKMGMGLVRVVFHCQ